MQTERPVLSELLGFTFETFDVLLEMAQNQLLLLGFCLHAVPPQSDAPGALGQLHNSLGASPWGVRGCWGWHRGCTWWMKFGKSQEETSEPGQSC